MKEIWTNYRAKFLVDVLLLCAAVIPAVSAFFLDFTGVTKDFFLRSGAIMALFAAFLEFRTHEIQALRERDNFHRIWSMLGVIAEGLANVDRTAKYSLRSLSVVIESAGMEPAMGKAADIKDMVVSEGVKALRYLPIVPESYYAYSKVMALVGKALVVTGTLIWAFGDFAVQFVKA